MSLRTKLQRVVYAALLISGLIQITAERASAHTEVHKTVTPFTIALPDPQPLLHALTMTKWQKVAVCETGGNWQMRGSVYSGGIGIKNTVWQAYGGGDFAPDAGLATPEQQVVVGQRIWAATGQPNHIPDQRGCEGAW